MKLNKMSRFLILTALFAVLPSCGGDVTLENIRVLPTATIVVTDSLVPLDDHALPFGSFQQGTVSDQTLIVANSGTASLVIGTVAAANPLAAPFSITADTCSGRTIAPGGTCSLTVRFAPSVAGAFNDSFDVPSNARNAAAVTVSVSGTGSALPVPNIAVTDPVAPSYDHQVPFGNVMQGNTSDKIVTVTNSGTASLVIGTVAAANPLAAPFSIIADTCSGQTIAPAGACSLTVRFAPAAVSSYSDSFDIPSNDPDIAAVAISVSGTASAPNIVVTDSVNPTNDHQVPFGSVTQNFTSTQAVTVRNSGTANLVIGTVASANPLVAPFSITADTCSGQTLAPSTTCSLTVRFAPTALGPYSDSFNIPSNDPDTATVTIAVSGTGTAPVPNIVVTDSVSPANDQQVPFGNVPLGVTSTQTVTVTNSGTADLVIGAVADTNPLAAPFSITADTCSGKTIAPAGTCSLTVRFTPSVAGAVSDQFNIPSNDPDTADITISVSGTGAGFVPQTGQTTCYDAAGNPTASCTNTGQDGELLKGVAWPSPRFTAGTGGAVDCITDNLTGLMWPKNGNLAQGNWQQALDYVATTINSGAGLCGFHDWRLPNKNELRSLAHYGQTSIAAWLNTQGFTNVIGIRYWSSTSYILSTTFAWAIYMSDGASLPNQKDGVFQVWPVRAGTDTAPAPVPRTGQTTCYDAAGGLVACTNTGQDGEMLKVVSWPVPRFTTNSDTTVTDNLTGLTWTSDAGTPTVAGTCTGGARLWQSALDYTVCLNANSYLGHTDWRLPNLNELLSLSNDGTSNSSGTWLLPQGFSNLQLNYWSSDSYVFFPNNGWVVNVAGNGLLFASKTSVNNNNYVWPVRGGL